MTAYRFCVKFDADPTSLWQDIVVGADRTIAELQSAINPPEARHVAHTLLQAADHIDACGHGDHYEDGPKQAHRQRHLDTDREATEVSGRPEATDASEACRRRHQHRDRDHWRRPR